MTMYRKRPVVVEVEGPINDVRYIETLEGTMKADVGDYIITGVRGEQYPIKPDVFLKTYEPVDPELAHKVAAFHRPRPA